MGLKVEDFLAFTSESIDATDIYLPLSDSAKADLLALLSDSNDYIYLSLRDDANFETVQVHAEGGLLIMKRGLESTTATKHPFGTCVAAVNPTTIAVIKDLICNYDCCEGGCACTDLSVSGFDLPGAYVSKSWSGSVTFSGTMPMSLNMSGAPGWMTVRQQSNKLMLSGTPSAAGTITMYATGTNCNGSATVSQKIVLTVGN